MLNKRIAITGATGLVGAHILRLLLRKGYHNIVAMRRPGSRLDLVQDVESGVQWIEGDITDVEAVAELVKGADAAIHCAAIISYVPQQFKAMHKVNVEGTANIVNACLEENVPYLLHMSSISVFRRTGGVQWIDESTPWEPSRYTSEYGLTKHLAEMEVWRGKAEGLRVSMLIPSVVMGSGYWKEGSTTMFYKSAKGLPMYPVGAYGFVDVRDLALLAVRSIEFDSVPERMIASGWNLSLKEILGKITQLAGHKPPRMALPPKAAEVLWRIMWPYQALTGKEPPISKSSARTTSCKLSFDNSLSLTVPSFSYTDLDQTIEDVMGNYKVAKTENFPAIPMDFLPHHLA